MCYMNVNVQVEKLLLEKIYHEFLEVTILFCSRPKYTRVKKYATLHVNLKI